MSTADDRTRLDEIEQDNKGQADILLARGEMDFICALARDGLRWRGAAAAKGEVEAALSGWCASSSTDEAMSKGWGIVTGISAALTAAAAWRAANAPKDDQIKYMTNRFLGWRLPKDFNPDNGISYTRPNYHPSVDATPTGTNLLDASQAEIMVRYMVEGMPTKGLEREKAEREILQKSRVLAFMEDEDAMITIG